MESTRLQEIPPDERPREKAERHGCETLADAELLAIHRELVTLNDITDGMIYLQVTRGNPGNIASITGASVGAGRTLEVIVNVADNLIDAGYQLHVDAAAEDMREGPSEVVIPFTSGDAGSGASGRRYIGNFQYSF